MRFQNQIQFEEIDKITPAKPKRRRGGNQYDPSFIAGGNWTVVYLQILLVASLVFLAVKVFSLQIIEGSKNLELSEGNSIRATLLRAERGVIFDRSGEVLARNKPGFSVELNTSLCEGFCSSVVTRAADVLKVDPATALDNLASGYAQISIASGLSRDEVLKIEVRLKDFPGVSTQVDPVRDFVYADAFSHVLGYVSSGSEGDKVGMSGVEKQYEQYLHGMPGSRLIRVNSSGSYFTELADKPPVRGKSVYVYLDKNLQTAAFEALKEAVEKKKALGGAVVATDPNTGGVLALVSYPAYNPNLFSTGISAKDYKALISDSRKPFFNRTIGALYPPGSTFKMVTALAALQSGVITEDKLVSCPSSINVNGYVFRDWYSGGRGEIDVKRALQVSCDTFFYAVSGGYGIQKGVGITEIANMARKLGFQKELGIDLEGEEVGVFPDPEWKKSAQDENWYLGDTYITSIGQGNILATPLQLNAMVSFFASKGKIYKPRVVRSIEGEPKINPELLVEDYSYSKYIESIREGMKLVVNPGGTAYPLFDFSKKHSGIELAGKTGTAEFGNPVETGSSKTHAWFTGFGPYDKPTIVLTVLLEGGGSGSDDAAPVARKIFDEWFK